MLIDGTRTGEVGDEVLRDRRHLAEDGLVVPVVAINKQTGALEGVPDIITRGVRDGSSQALLRRLRRGCSASRSSSVSVEERTDQGLIKEKLRVELRRFFRKRSGRRPLRAARHHGDLTWQRSTVSRRVSEFVGVALFAAALIWIISLASYEPTDPVWFFSTGRARARRRTSPAASARSSPSCRSSCSATRRT